MLSGKVHETYALSNVLRLRRGLAYKLEEPVRCPKHVRHAKRLRAVDAAQAAKNGRARPVCSPLHAAARDVDGAHRAGRARLCPHGHARAPRGVHAPAWHPLRGTPFPCRAGFPPLVRPCARPASRRRNRKRRRSPARSVRQSRRTGPPSRERRFVAAGANSNARDPTRGGASS